MHSVSVKNVRGAKRRRRECPGGDLSGEVVLRGTGVVRESCGHRMVIVIALVARSFGDGQSGWQTDSSRGHWATTLTVRRAAPPPQVSALSSIFVRGEPQHREVHLHRRRSTSVCSWSVGADALLQMRSPNNVITTFSLTSLNSQTIWKSFFCVFRLSKTRLLHFLKWVPKSRYHSPARVLSPSECDHNCAEWSEQSAFVTFRVLPANARIY